MDFPRAIYSQMVTHKRWLSQGNGRLVFPPTMRDLTYGKLSAISAQKPVILDV
jgi:hypothetical protein